MEEKGGWGGGKTFPIEDLGFNQSPTQNENKYLHTSMLSLSLSCKNSIVDLSGCKFHCDE